MLRAREIHDGIFSGFSSETNQNKKEKYVNISIDKTIRI